MEGVVLKLPSSFKLITPFTLRSTTTTTTTTVKVSKFRNFSCAATASSDIAVEKPCLSLGHITRPDFPILHQNVNKSKLVYLDNAATSQKPTAVLDSLHNYYSTYNSNVHRGSVLPIKDITSWAHNVGAKVLVDACQSVPHMVVDVQNLDADFLVASSHKMCGPTGAGFLYGKSGILSGMPPFLGGGEMISDVFLDYSTYAEPPSRLMNLFKDFVPSTPAVYLQCHFRTVINTELATYLHESLRSIPNVRIYGPVPSEHVCRASLCSFNVENIHPTDIATFLDQEYGVAIRSGHHCAQPLHRYLGINASARASLHLYNTTEDVDAFITALKGTIDFFVSSL
ncbi:hypothetical protein IFM89_033539 [Coptis chinensis]|uniref:Aminotransferase class V domain-containing protein n=1 Tax=Coptis chinensis TaxID=261450 RepID=A0A835H852_9MAGN|nr:hypothetical protein IFM89_033539 [Coptis chinensis]